MGATGKEQQHSLEGSEASTMVSLSNCRKSGQGSPATGRMPQLEFTRISSLVVLPPRTAGSMAHDYPCIPSHTVVTARPCTAGNSKVSVEVVIQSLSAIRWDRNSLIRHKGSNTCSADEKNDAVQAIYAQRE